ncbi:D-xylose 1-dehydrogenase [Colletotrichum fructicola]|nr:D-xylose 1-dehydrogenase [Colletotrichum fructicola]
MPDPFVLRWGIMATGAMSEYFCKDLLTNPSTRAVTDISHTIAAVSSSNDPSKASAFLSRIAHPAPSTVNTYGSYQALVNDLSVDIVYIATPHSHHFQNAMLALTAGKHVLCEKALCVTAAQARCLVLTAKERKLFFMEGVWTRFFPLSRRICELVSGGEIGTVYRVSADLSRANGDGDDVTGKRLDYEDRHRMVNPELAGGVLLGLGVYALTWVFQILYHLQSEDEKEAPEVKAAVQKYHTGIDESVAMLLSFPRHGAVGVATASLRVATDPGETGNPAVRIQGSKGEIQVAHPAYKPALFRIIKQHGNGGESVEEVVECPQPQDGLVRCASLLRGEAVNGFAEHVEAYESFANGAAYLRKFLEVEGEALKPHLRVELRSLNRLLKDFLARMQQLQPSLGKDRKEKGFQRIIQKIRWPFYEKILSGICHKLSSKFNMIKFIVDLNNGSSIRFMNLCPSAGLPRPPVPGPKIVLVDARSEYHGLSMAGVKSWDDLATFIERLFCVGGQSCLAVKNRSYILRNNTTEEMFLVNSPSIPPWEDSVQDGHELEMSMLFPNHTDYNSFCPKCKRFWSNPVSMEMFCTRCGLSARFLDSFDDEPDPVTSLALKDIRRTGLRLVIEQTMLGFGEREPKKMKNQEMLYEQTMNALAKSKNELGPRPMAPARNDKSEIKDFRRITLCSEQWPDFARAVSAANWNNNRARAIVRGLKHFLAAKTFSESALAFIVNNSIIGTRRGPETAFLQSIIDASTDRQTLWVPPQEFLSSLEDYICCARNAKAQHSTSAFQLRCLLWTYSETLELHADLIRTSCCLFNRWSGSERSTQIIFSSPRMLTRGLAVPQGVICELSLDIVAGIARIFRERDPVHVLACLPLLIKDSAEIAVAYHLDGNLAAYFRQARVSRDSAVHQLNHASQRWIESTTESRGKLLVDESTFTMICNRIYGVSF